MTDWGALALELQAARLEHFAPVVESKQVGAALAVATGVRSNTDNCVVCKGDIPGRFVRETCRDRRLMPFAAS